MEVIYYTNFGGKIINYENSEHVHVHVANINLKLIKINNEKNNKLLKYILVLFEEHSPLS